MRMPQELEEAFNDQIGMELSSSTAYLQMSAYFAGRNLLGMSRWMRAQAEEERSHAHRFLDFVLNRGNQAKLGAINRCCGSECLSSSPDVDHDQWPRLRRPVRCL